MDGSKNTSSHQVNYCGHPDQDDMRNKMALSHHNLTAHKNIEDLVPNSVCPHGMMHTLLTNSPDIIRSSCNFIKTDKDEKSFFDVDDVYDDKSKVLTKMKNKTSGLKCHVFGEKIIFIDSKDDAQVDSLNELLKP
jgi:hypothetical protein